MDTQDYKDNNTIEKIARDVRENPETSIRMFKRALPLLAMLLLAGLLWGYFHFSNCTSKKEVIPNIKLPKVDTPAVDDEAKAALAKWTQTLGAKAALNLPDGSTIQIPQNGFENKLVEYLNQGCPGDVKSNWFNCDRLLFQSGSANLNEVSLDQIIALSTLMKSYPSSKFKIGGYTDNTGDSNINKELSAQRAKAVRDALIQQGVAADRLQSEGYGQLHPVCPANDSEECKEKNRRVAIRVEQCK